MREPLSDIQKEQMREMILQVRSEIDQDLWASAKTQDDPLEAVRMARALEMVVNRFSSGLNIWLK